MVVLVIGSFKIMEYLVENNCTDWTLLWVESSWSHMRMKYLLDQAGRPR